MILQPYQVSFSQNFFSLSKPRISLSQLVIQKNRQHFVTRCEIDPQAHNQAFVYQPTLWSHDFIQGLETNFPYKEKVEEIEEKVIAMITEYENCGKSTVELLELIDDVERLGLGYRFQTDIKRLLNKIVAINENGSGHEEDNLYEASLKFRLLRQHGYNVSQGFLRKFKDSHGGVIQTDVKSLLSLYEASYVGFEEETDLHEAKLFATEELLKINGYEKDVMDHVNHALDIPLYRRIPRLEARWYIDAYGKRNDANPLLLELAILDFNMIQSTLKRDLQEVSKWWENIGLARKLSFIRNRIMECFFVSVSAVFEPRYSSCRVGITKVCSLIAALDDIYEIYGSLDELEVFKDAVKRWDINAMKYMPEYLQQGFLALYNTVNDMGYHTLNSQGENSIPILAKAWGELMDAHFMEAKWAKRDYMPTLEEYIDNALRSISQVVVLTHGYFLMNLQDVNKDTTEHLINFHDLFKWSSLISRLCNDSATSLGEMERGEYVNAVSCYMHEYGVSKDVAREYIETLSDKAWRKMLEAQVACSKESTYPIGEMAVNLTRFSHCIYQSGDGFGAPDVRAKDRVLSLIIEPIKYSV